MGRGLKEQPLVVRAYLKRVSTYTNHDTFTETNTLHLVTMDGEDLKVTASDKIYQLAKEMDRMTLVLVETRIEYSRQDGRVRLQAEELQQLDLDD